MPVERKIIVSNNGTVVYPYKPKMCIPLERKCYDWDPVYFKYKEVSGFYLPYRDGYCFATHGMDIRRLQSWLPDYIVETRPMINAIPINVEFDLNDDIEFREQQFPIVEQLTEAMKGNREIFINLPTGFGKTLISIYIASVYGYKTMITCFSTKILAQWMETLREKTTYDTSRVCQLTSGKMLKDFLDGNKDPSKYDIFISTPNLLSVFGKTHGYDKLDILYRIFGIGLAMFDEAHRNMGFICRINAVTNVPMTIYMSADFSVGQSSLKDKYYAIFSKTNVIKPSAAITESMKYTSAVICEFDSHPNMLEKESIFNKYGYSSQLYMEYQMKKPDMLIVIKSIMEYIMRNNPNGYRTLILLSMIAHTEKVGDAIREKYPDKIVGVYHSQIEPEKKMEITKTADIIVSTYQSFSTGVDITDPPIKFILSTDNPNPVNDNQSAGRARPLPDGTETLYFMIVDKGHPYTLKKLRTRLEYLAQYKLKDTTRIHFKT